VPTAVAVTRHRPEAAEAADAAPWAPRRHHAAAEATMARGTAGNTARHAAGGPARRRLAAPACNPARDCGLPRSL